MRDMQLRNLQSTDFGLLLRLFTDNTVRKYLGGALPAAEAAERIEKLLRDIPESYWVIVVDGNPIGTVILGEHVDSGETELSYQLLPEWTGRGFAIEAVRAALKAAKGSVVVAETQVKNLKSRKLLEKIGFEETAILERFGEHQAYYELRTRLGTCSHPTEGDVATYRMTEHSAWRVSLAHRIAPLFTAFSAVEACFIFGSVALGISDQYSDLELAFIWPRLPSAEDLEATAQSVGVNNWKVEPYGEAKQAWLEQFHLYGMKVEAAHWAHSTVDKILVDVVQHYDTSQNGILFA